MKPILRLILMAGGSAIMAAPAAVASAQPVAVDELVVTARRQEEQLKDVPLAVTAMSGESLKQAAITGVETLQYRTPSLAISPATGSNSSASIALRGQVQNASLGTLDPAVGVYLDDVYFGRSYGAMFQFLDIDRVEVLKGPQGTLYGRNTTGGAVKLISTKANPSKSFNGFVTAEYGNYDQRQVEGAVGLPLIEDRLALRVAARVQRRDGFGTLNIGPFNGPDRDQIKQNDVHDDQVRANLVWTPSSKLTLSMSGDYFDSRNNSRLGYARTVGGGDHITATNAAGLAVAGVRSSDDFYTARSNIRPFSDVQVYGVSGLVEYEVSDSLSAKLVASHRRTDSIFLYDADGTDFPHGANTIIQNAHQSSVELQVNGSGLDGRLDAVGGAFYFIERGQDFADVRRFSSASRLGGYFENESASAYIHANFDVSDRLGISGGLRYTRDGKYALLANSNIVNGALVCSINASIPGLIINSPSSAADPCYLPRDKNFGFISWSAAVDYHATDDLLFYARADNSSRSGGQNLRATTPGGSLPFGPEKATTIELGAKGDVFDGRLSFAADYYHTFYKDYQYTANAPSGLATGAVVTLTANASGASNIDGVELEATAQLTDRFSIDVAGSWVNVKLSQPVEAPQGVAVQLIPEYQYSIGGMFTQPVSFGEVRARVEYVFKDDIAYDASRVYSEEPGHRLPSIGLLNASLTLSNAADDLQLQLWVRNLTNEKYFVRSIRITGFPSVGPNWDYALAGDPRMYGVRLTKRW